MPNDEARTLVRRLCYGALPLGAVLVAPAFALMPNRHRGASFYDQEPMFQLGFLLALAGFALVGTAMLILVLWAED